GRAVENFFRRESVEVHLRQGRLDGAAEIDVVRAVELRGQTRLDAHFGGTHLPGFHGAAYHLVEGQEVAFLLAVVAGESAEGAVLDAHVGEVDVPVHHVSDDVTCLPAAHLVGHEGKRVQLTTLHLGETDALVHRELAALEGAAEDPPHVAVDPVQVDGRAAVQFHVRHLSRSPRTSPCSSIRRCTFGRNPSSMNSGRPAYSG